jgi:hypothetical protein
MTGKGGEVAKAVLDNVGKDVAIAYGVFLIFALFVNFMGGTGLLDVNLKLPDLLSEHMGIGGHGRGIFLVLLAFATIAVPYFWRHKIAPLAFAVPLVITLMGFVPLYEQHRQKQQTMEAMGELSRALGQMAEQMAGDGGGVFSNLGFGAYIIFAAVVYLAYKGVTKFLGGG